MADGPTHYSEAERFLLRSFDDDQSMADSTLNVARAQVHATLALAAATAQLDAYEGPGGGSCTGRSAAEVNGWESAFANGGSR